MNRTLLTYPEHITPADTWNVDDSTKLNEYQTCPRKYFYRYVLGWQIDRPNVHLVFGGAIHEALDYLLTTMKNGGDVSKESHIINANNKFLEYYSKHFSDEEEAALAPKDSTGAMYLINGWVQKWKNAPLEVLYVEVPGNVPVGDPDEPEKQWQLHFKIDTIVRSQEGICSLEHKTTGQNSHTWRDGFQLSLQVGTYIHVLYSLFPENEVYGVLIDGLIVKKTGVDFETIPVRRTPEHMAAWYWQVLNLLNTIDHNFQLLSECKADSPALEAFPMNTESCTKYGTCPYHSLCMSWPNPLKSLHRRPVNMKVEHWDPRGTVQNPKQYVDGTRLVEVQQPEEEKV